MVLFFYRDVVIPNACVPPFRVGWEQIESFQILSSDSFPLIRQTSKTANDSSNSYVSIEELLLYLYIHNELHEKISYSPENSRGQICICSLRTSSDVKIVRKKKWRNKVDLNKNTRLRRANNIE